MRALNQDELDQLFPTECHFKVICRDRDGIHRDLNEALVGIGLTGVAFQANTRSTQGTYISFDLSIVVESHKRMQAIDAAIRAVEGVRMLL